jgi:hypothetical protein
MRHDRSITTMGGLPDAPLAMPKQILERNRVSILSALRAVLAAALPRF